MEQQTPPTDPTEESIFTEEDYSMKGYDKHVRNARIALYGTAVYVLLSLFMLQESDELAKKITIAIIIFIASVFGLLGYWSTRRPFTAILIGLILFVGLQVLIAIADPASLMQGWFIKIAIPLFLITGLRNAKEMQDRKKAFGK